MTRLPDRDEQRNERAQERNDRQHVEDAGRGREADDAEVSLKSALVAGSGMTSCR